MSTHELGPLPEPDGWALGDAYYPAKSTQLGRVRFAGAKAERYTAEQVLAEVARAVESERERCVAVIESFPHWIGLVAKREIAAAIREGAR